MHVVFLRPGLQPALEIDPQQLLSALHEIAMGHTQYAERALEHGSQDYGSSRRQKAWHQQLKREPAQLRDRSYRSWHHRRSQNCGQT